MTDEEPGSYHQVPSNSTEDLTLAALRELIGLLRKIDGALTQIHDASLMSSYPLAYKPPEER